MSNLCEQVSFILSGGALRSLVEFLTPKVSAALIVRPKDADLEIVDAVGPTLGDLFLRGWAPKLAAAFPERTKGKKFEVSHAPIEGEWPWAVAIRGKQWTFYILLRETPDAVLADLHHTAGLIALWQDFKHLEEAEERLSRMAYMILATKSTLASIFEPMPLGYYAAFLTDVVNESLFPRSISIYQDGGATLIPVEGEDPPPERTGIYSQKMLPSIPVVTKNDSHLCEVVLPIIVEPLRLFCVIKWDEMPAREALDFLELINSLASQALTINTLRAENTNEKSKISSGQYTILTLNEALNALKNEKNRRALLSMTVDIFTEMTRIEECLLVAWDAELQGYAPFEYRRGNMKTPCEPLVLPSDRVSSETETQFFDLDSPEFSRLIGSPWPEMAAMKLVFPFWNMGLMDGFIAVSSDRSTLKEGDKLSALGIVAQFTAFALGNLV